MEYSMKNCITAILILVTVGAFAGEAAYMDNLSVKKMATFEDAVICFNYLYGTQLDASADYETRLTELQKSVKYLPKKYGAEKPLTVGDFSLLAIQYLEINSGLFYLATRSGRYASRELSSREIIDYNTSEWSVLSGIDLIRILQKVGEYAAEE
jgi:hypothetical protein